MAPEEGPRGRQPDYTLYRSRRRAVAAPEAGSQRRSVGELIIRAGAVAAAIGSIVTVVTLVWPDSPARQGAKLSNVSHERNVTLADFTVRQEVAALNPRDARGRLAERPQSTGPPGLAGVLLASAEVPLDGAAPPPDGEGGTSTDPDPPPPDTTDPDPPPPDTTDPDPPPPEPEAEEPAPTETPGSSPGSSEVGVARITEELDNNFDVGCEFAEPRCSMEVWESVSGGDDANGVGGGDAPAGEGDEALQRAKQLLRVLRNTRVRASPSASGSGGTQEVLGVTVSFDLQLVGFEGRRSNVRWSLYDARGRRRVPRDWLVNRRVLSLRGKANEDRASKEFWVPLPRRKGPFFVRVGVYDDEGTRLTYEDTRPFR